MSVPEDPDDLQADDGPLDEALPDAPQGARPILGLLAGLAVIVIALGVSLFAVFNANQAGPAATSVPVVAAVETVTLAPSIPIESPLPPTAVPTSAPAPAATEPAAATEPPATAETATVAETTAPVETPPAASATAVDESVQATLAWHDDIVFNDAVVVSASGLPAPEEGTVYGVWLAGEESSLSLGTLALANTGPAIMTYVSPTHENLLASYDRVFITRVPSADAAIEVVNAVQAGALPSEALVHIRHLLVGITLTPNGAGFAVGLRQESNEVVRHAGFLKAAFEAGDLPLIRLHAEHLINMIEGSQGEHFGDRDGDGKVKNPGDGYGILQNGSQLGYATGMTDHARLASIAADATDSIKLHAGHVQIVGDNVRQWAGEIRDRALHILATPGIPEMQDDVTQISAVAQRLVNGVDLNLNDQIEPVPGEGGVLTAYQHSQLMAGITLGSDVTSVAAAPQPGPAATAQPVHISIADLVFKPSKITVPVGTTVIWENPSGEAHTVTADDGTFDRPRLEPGETFEQQFTTPGVFPYFCGIHGGRGGEGMSGTIIVAGTTP